MHSFKVSCHVSAFDIRSFKVSCHVSTFDIRSFQNRLDMETLVILGHSFGGATMVRALKEITQLKCGFGLDVWFEPLKESFYDFNEMNEKPNFLITTQYFIWKKNLALYHKYNKCFKNKEKLHISIRWILAG